MASEQLGATPAISADLIRKVDLDAATGPSFTDTFPLGAGVWTDYTPTLTQSATITKTNFSRYWRIGRWVHVEFGFAITSAGTANNPLTMTLPVTASAGSVATGGGGSATFIDASASLTYGGVPVLASSTTMQITNGGTSTTGAQWGETGGGFALAVANGDFLWGTLDYEAASGGSATGSPTAAWVDYTPTLTQSGAVTKTVNTARYIQIGRMVHVEFFLTMTGAGTSNNSIQIGLPVAPSSGSLTSGSAGSATLVDSSASTAYGGVSYIFTSSTMAFQNGGSTTSAAQWGETGGGFTAALASGDQITGTLTYEAAEGGGIPPVSYDWATYTPTFTQSATITKTVTTAKYTQVGRTVHVEVQLVATSAGTASNPVLVGLPVACKAGTTLMGQISIYDASIFTVYIGSAFSNDSVTVKGFAPATTATMGNTGGGFAVAIASGDEVYMNLTYEAA